MNAELLQRYDKPGPRYTSYPTAKEFHDGVGSATYKEHLARAAQKDAPLALYLHLPFCEERCLFCGCNVVIAKRRDILPRYLDALHQEIRRLGAHLKDRRVVTQYHWGGGTPTYLAPDGDNAIEVDPRVTTVEHLETLRDLGFNRISMGVQDFTPQVQEAVHRIQPFEITRDLVDTARKLGFLSTNLDLIYGLPHQKVATFTETLEQVNEIRPERIAVYSFAHVPWMKGHQRCIPIETLPAPETKLNIFAAAIESFDKAGYLAIGMDHFALPEDEMGRALKNGTLWRNFMGYTVKGAPDMVACGMSGIGNVAGGFFQNHSKLIDYERDIEDGNFAIERGYVLHGQDELRSHIITALMCAFFVDVKDVERRFGIDFWDTFSRGAFAELIADGFVEVRDDRIDVVGHGRLFVRNVAMLFDERTRRDQVGFSRTV